MNRIDRLRELLEEPLLITNLVNVRYLTAQGIEGVETVMTKRSLMAWLGETLSGKVGFEANVLPWSFAEDLRAAGLDLVPRIGLV